MVYVPPRQNFCATIYREHYFALKWLILPAMNVLFKISDNVVSGPYSRAVPHSGTTLWQVNSSDISKDCNAIIGGQSVQEQCDTPKVKASRSLKMPRTLRPTTQKTWIFMNNNPQTWNYLCLFDNGSLKSPKDTYHHHHIICHGDGPLVYPFWSHVSRSLFKGLP